MKTRILKIAVAFVVGMLMIPISAHALRFRNITHNNSVDAWIGEDQMRVYLSDPLGGRDGTATQALFSFRNLGPEVSSITKIYFDDGTLLGIADIINYNGVSFHEEPRGNLPSGNQLTVMFVADFVVDPDSNGGLVHNGINPYERLDILFDLINENTLHDTIKALMLGHTDPANDEALRIGIHVQGYNPGGSESFVAAVAEPGTILILGSGLISLAFYRRIKFRK